MSHTNLRPFIIKVSVLGYSPLHIIDNSKRNNKYNTIHTK